MDDVVTLLGREWPVRIPPQFAVREELVLAYGEHADNTSKTQRVYAAVLGICCPEIGKAAKADYRAAGFDVLAYGGAVYGHLRESGASMQEVAAAAAPLITRLDAMVFPRPKDVRNKAGFTEAPEDDKSGRP